MYSNNILKFQESMIILNACTKKSGNLLKAPRITFSNFNFFTRNEIYKNSKIGNYFLITVYIDLSSTQLNACMYQYNHTGTM